MRDLTVSEIWKHKETLCRAIGKAMDDFYDATDLPIDEITFSHEQGLGPGYIKEDGTEVMGSVHYYHHAVVSVKI